jgi:TrmH family RNA methyltransferase
MLTSTQNPLLKRLKKLSQSKRQRHDERCYIVENRHYISELIHTEPAQIEIVIITDSNQDIEALCEKNSVKFVTVADGLLDAVTHVKHSQGVVAIVHMPEISSTCPKSGAHLYLSGLSNPSNFGSICRNAAAFGVSTIVYPPSSVDPYHPESIRASGGNHHRLLFVELSFETYIASYPRQFISLSSSDGENIYDITFEKEVTFIVGSEMGFKGALKGTLVKIPMMDAVDSLNVAVSTGIVLSSYYSKA